MRPRSASRPLAFALVLAAALAACSDDAPTSVSEDLTYGTPAGARDSGTPGQVLRREPIELAPEIVGTGWKIEYVSSVPDPDQSKVSVSGVVIVPPGPAPEGGWPIVSYAHGTTGTADACAPSRALPFSIPGADQLVAAGFLVVGTDYYGQDGFDDADPQVVHPYLVGEIEGRNVLDAARAARDEFGGNDTLVTWGHSQGGHSSLWARGIAQSYAPDLDLVGTVAFAPVTSIAGFAGQGITNEWYTPYTIEVIQGWSTAYEEIDFSDVLVPEEAEKARLTQLNCGNDLEPIDGSPVGTVFRSDPSNWDQWTEAADLNSAPATDGPPVFLSHGDGDTIVPVAGSDDYVAALCALGVAVDYLRLPGQGHTGGLTEAVTPAVQWSLARLAGDPPPTTCPSTNG